MFLKQASGLGKSLSCVHRPEGSHIWVFSRAGFFSAVRKGSEKAGEICVRARVLADLELLKELYYPEMGRIHQSEGTDYPYRIYMSTSAWARVMENMARDVDYKNFKGMVSGERGYAVADLYSDVWAVMYGAEKKVVPQRKPIPVDYADRNAPPFEEWRLEKGVQARKNAGISYKDTSPTVEEMLDFTKDPAPSSFATSKTSVTRAAVEEPKPAKVSLPRPKPTRSAMEVFNERYEKAQQQRVEARQASRNKKRRKAGDAPPPPPVRGPNGKFVSRGQ